MNVDLSIIILSYNTCELTKRCVLAIIRNLKNNKITFEVIVVDNGSVDGSEAMLVELKKNNKEIKILANKKNIGFAKANNLALNKVKGTNILYLNSDVIVEKVDFDKLINYLNNNNNVAGLTVNVVLTAGNIDPASHRGFPTVWNSFCYLTGLESLTRNIEPLNRLFGGYHLTSLKLNQIHEIDSPSGAFFLVKKKVIEKINGFDEDFFFYGEDIDLAFRIKKAGYKIIYYPLYQVLHLKSSSGLKKEDDRTRSKTRGYFYDAMYIFYQKHYRMYYPSFFNKIIYSSIDFLKKTHA